MAGNIHRAAIVLRPLDKRVDQVVGNPVEHRSGEPSHQRTVEFVLQAELDLARAGLKRRQSPFTFNLRNGPHSSRMAM